MTEAAKELLQALEELVENPPENYFGICAYLKSFNEEAGKLFAELYPQWPEFSGRRNYPVPYREGKDPADAYHAASADEMWSREHPYGAARWRLVEWCIEQLKETPK